MAANVPHPAGGFPSRDGILKRETKRVRVSSEPDGARWRVVSSTYPIHTAYLRLRADTVELPNGTRVEEYFVRESHGFCIIFALTPAADVVLVRQYKHGIGEVILELPAGAIDEGEEPADCAARELREETGYAGRPPELIASYIADPTNSNARFFVYLIRNAELVHEPDPEPTESIVVETVPLGAIRDLIGPHGIDVGSHVAAIYTTLDRLGI
jgi:8-oxo-dGTP pyrophosphatase MutT (NUDIX family)